MATPSQLVFSAQRIPPQKDKLSDDPVVAPKLSFRNKLLGNKTIAPRREKTYLIAKGLCKVELEDGDRLLQKFYIEENMFKELCEPWHEALVIKLLGKRIGYKTMEQKLTVAWRLAGGFDLMDVDNGFYMVKFEREEDGEKVIRGGPWMIFDHYLAVSNWSPDFVSATTQVDKTLVWIRFPGINLAYYDESLLLAMASVVRRPIKVDNNTVSVDKGRFVRICVEIDLSQPMVGKIWVRETWHKIEYEGLHIICRNCGCYGHVQRNCNMQSESITQVLTIVLPMQVFYRIHRD